MEYRQALPTCMAHLTMSTQWSVVTTTANCMSNSRVDKLAQIRAAQVTLQRAILQTFPPRLSRVDRLAQIRAAQITLRRAILQSFPPGRERQKRLAWLKQVIISARTLERGAS
jgi:hypothetical protein